jgi:hypothetical protein
MYRNMTEHEKEKKLLKELAEINLRKANPDKTYVRVYGNSETRMALGMPGESYLVEEKKINLE